MYKVILHNGIEALRQEPEMEEPIWEDIIEDDYIEDKDTTYDRRLRAYTKHLADCEKNIIPIAPEYQGHWKVGQLVKDSEFSKRDKYKEFAGFYDYGGPEYKPILEAIPKPLEQEKEEGLPAILKEIACDFYHENLIDRNKGYSHIRSQFDEWINDNKYWQNRITKK